MRFCGSFSRILEVARTKHRAEGHVVAGQSRRPALLAVDYADRLLDRQAGITERRGQRFAEATAPTYHQRAPATSKSFAGPIRDESSLSSFMVNFNGSFASVEHEKSAS